MVKFQVILDYNHLFSDQGYESTEKKNMNYTSHKYYSSSIPMFKIWCLATSYVFTTFTIHPHNVIKWGKPDLRNDCGKKGGKIGHDSLKLPYLETEVPDPIVVVSRGLPIQLTSLSVEQCFSLEVQIFPSQKYSICFVFLQEYMLFFFRHYSFG